MVVPTVSMTKAPSARKRKGEEANERVSVAQQEAAAVAAAAAVEEAEEAAAAVVAASQVR